MSGETRELTLLVPDLFDTVAAHPADYLGEMLASRPAPAGLTRLLSRAARVRAPHADIDQLLGGLFNMPATQLAVGALSRLGESRLATADDMPVGGLWLRADPVYLHPDMSQLLLMAGEQLEISAPEAVAYIAELNAEFAARGWCFQAPHPGRWYLHMPDMPADMSAVDFASLHEVNGGNVLPFMPTGKTGAKWRALLNEIQVLLHSCAVNEHREQRGLPPINGVWLWGMGELPQAGQAHWAGIWSDYRYARGLALLNKCPLRDIPERLGDFLPAAGNGEHLLLLNRPPKADEDEQWLDWLQVLDRDWFVPLLDALRAGDVRRLRIWPSRGECYTLTRRAAKQWWRRDKPLLGFIRHAA